MKSVLDAYLKSVIDKWACFEVFVRTSSILHKSTDCCTHCCHVLSDELSPVNVRGGDNAEIHTYYIHWCIDNLWREAWSALTLAMSGLSLWDCDKHGELFLASFHLQQSLDLYYVGDRKVGQHRLIKIESWKAHDFINIKPRRWHYVTAPWQAHCSLHIVTLNILKFCQGHQPSTRTLVTAIHLRWGDTGVTSINNYPGTIWELLMVTWVCAEVPGLRVELLGGLRTRFWSEWHLIPSVIVSNYSIKVSIETPCTGAHIWTNDIKTSWKVLDTDCSNASLTVSWSNFRSIWLRHCILMPSSLGGDTDFSDDCLPHSSVLLAEDKNTSHRARIPPVRTELQSQS